MNSIELFARSRANSTELFVRDRADSTEPRSEVMRLSIVTPSTGSIGGLYGGSLTKLPPVVGLLIQAFFITIELCSYI